MKTIIYTHTDFIDIFKIQYEHIIKLISIDNIIIFSNNNNVLYEDFILYTYDDILTYPERILSCLNKMTNKDEYYLVIHENDIMIKYNDIYINNISTIMKDDNIHRVDLCSFNSNSSISRYNITLNKNNNFYLFSVGPSIWNISIYEDILINNSNSTYRNIEYYGTNYIINKNYNVYNIYTEHNLKNTYLNRVFPDFCFFLHITTMGAYVLDKNSDYYNYALELYDTYNISRRIHYH
jgi:hypothetical protein